MLKKTQYLPMASAQVQNYQLLYQLGVCDSVVFLVGQKARYKILYFHNNKKKRLAENAFKISPFQNETTCSLSECTRNLFILTIVQGSALYQLDTVEFRNNTYFARRGGRGCR